MSAVVAFPHPPTPVDFTFGHWIDHRDRLLAAMERTGTHGELHVVSALLCGNMQMWIRGSSAVITEIVAYPLITILSVFAAGGTIKEIKDLMPMIESYAKKNGCKRVRIEGRHGWVRWADELGYRDASAVGIKDI